MSAWGKFWRRVEDEGMREQRVERETMEGGNETRGMRLIIHCWDGQLMRVRMRGMETCPEGLLAVKVGMPRVGPETSCDKAALCIGRGPV